MRGSPRRTGRAPKRPSVRQPCSNAPSLEVPNKPKSLAQQDAHFRVMRFIEANPASTQRDIAKSFGISLGSVNYCLNALIEVGFVKVRNFRTSQNKLRYAYILTPKGASEKTALTGAFLQRKIREYEALKSEIETLRLEAGALNLEVQDRS